LSSAAAARHDIPARYRWLNLQEAAIAAFDEVALRVRAWGSRPIDMQIPHHDPAIMSEFRAISKANTGDVVSVKSRRRG
jgi:hypothetical protein